MAEWDMTIIKGDKHYPYDKTRIRNAIIQAYNQICYPDFDEIDMLLDEIEDLIWTEAGERREIAVEKVENIVIIFLPVTTHQRPDGIGQSRFRLAIGEHHAPAHAETVELQGEQGLCFSRAGGGQQLHVPETIIARQPQFPAEEPPSGMSKTHNPG